MSLEEAGLQRAVGRCRGHRRCLGCDNVLCTSIDASANRGKLVPEPGAELGLIGWR